MSAIYSNRVSCQWCYLPCKLGYLIPYQCYRLKKKQQLKLKRYIRSEKDTVIPLESINYLLNVFLYSSVTFQKVLLLTDLTNLWVTPRWVNPKDKQISKYYDVSSVQKSGRIKVKEGGLFMIYAQVKFSNVFFFKNSFFCLFFFLCSSRASVYK